MPQVRVKGRGHRSGSAPPGLRSATLGLHISRAVRVYAIVPLPIAVPLRIAIRRDVRDGKRPARVRILLALVVEMRDLQLDEDLSFQRREWRLERAGWGALVVGVLAAAAGAFGDGPLSHTRISAAAGRLVVEYDRMVRHSASSEIRVRISPPGNSGEAALWIDLPYLRDVEITSIVPEPSRTEHRGEHVAYVFPVASHAAPLEIIVRYEPTRAGRLSGRLGTSDGATVTVRQVAFF